MVFKYFFAALLLSVSIGLAQARSPVSAPTALPAPDAEGRISLDGTDWKIQSATVVGKVGEAVSTISFPAADWHPAKVPGTVLANYLRDGLVLDPNFGDQIKSIPEEIFQQDFWYRKEFTAPLLSPDKHLFFNVDGINWKADIYLNGSSVGHIDGAFQRGQFEITDKIIPGKTNAVAFLIHKCAHPGPADYKGPTRLHNGGVLGGDSPTFLATIGWNWMLTVPGRDIGIWDHVSLQQTGSVMLVAPFVHSTVAKDRQTADLTIEVTAKNLTAAAQQATLTGTIGKISFMQKCALRPNETKQLTFSKGSFPQLSVTHPPLWWPNGYGGQPLQLLRVSISAAGGPSSDADVTFGIRELSYDTSDKILKILCNGQRIQLNGGNWGMADTLLRYDAKDFDIAVHLHQQMHMTMIRNWVGQVGKEEFFKTCDKYGLLVWNDFWLANPADGNNPDDHSMFVANVHDRILRIRNHPSLGLYCGRNEGYPPKDLDKAMAAATTSLDGTRFYIPDSKTGLVTGGGPYEPKPDAWYFKNLGKTLHSELGIVCVPTADSMRLMMPKKDLWPIDQMWYLHDFYQSRCRVYTNRIDKSYGPSSSIDEFCERAQMENWENAKAMMEAWRSNSGSGGLIWMSHPAWPSLICQLYDYYLNPTAAYFGVKIANEPLHILWDASTSTVKVANNTGSAFQNLQAQAWIYDMDGTERSHQVTQINSGSDGMATDCFTLNFPDDLTPVHFVKLTLNDGSRIVSNNFYWRGIKTDDYKMLNEMPKVKIMATCEQSKQSDESTIDIHLDNPTSSIALMICVKVVNSSTAQRILPIVYDNNYVTLLPHEKREIHARYDLKLQGDRQPKVVIQGWNVPTFNEQVNIAD